MAMTRGQSDDILSNAKPEHKKIALEHRYCFIILSDENSSIQQLIALSWESYLRPLSLTRDQTYLKSINSIISFRMTILLVCN